MSNIDSHQHVVKTTAQWNERAVQFWIIPRGCLCIELTNNHQTRIKVGEGDKYYKQLPYITDEADLSNYYTKTEIDNIIANINKMSIQDPGTIYPNKDALPKIGNKLGDVRFVSFSDPTVTHDPEMYIWDSSKWICVGLNIKDIDLSKYLTKDAFERLFNPVVRQVNQLIEHDHTHSNYEILEATQEPYTTREKNKLKTLKNYDSQIEELEQKAHTHSNYDILEQSTAPFTREDKTKLDSLVDPVPFTGATEDTDGTAGLVPAPSAGDQNNYLRGDGTWSSSTISPATKSSLGGVIVGNGLSVDENGVVDVDAYTDGDAIRFGEPINPIIGDITTLKFSITEVRSMLTHEFDGEVELSSIEFYDTNGQIIPFSAVSSIFEAGFDIPAYGEDEYQQTPDKLIDGDNTHVCRCVNFSDEAVALSFVFQLNIPTQITNINNYLWCTGLDQPNSDPISWKLSVSTDNGATWIEIDKHNRLSTPTARTVPTTRYYIREPDYDKSSINVKCGVGITVDENNALTLDERTEFVFNCDYNQNQ